MRKAFYAGSFDPITYGHMDIIQQTLKIFDKIVICPMQNSSKSQGLFSLEERYELIKSIYSNSENVEVIYLNKAKAAIKIAEENGCIAMVRGLRNITDFQLEKQMSDTNFVISKGKIMTIPFFAHPNKLDISSSMVKELFSLDIDIDDYVPSIVKEAINNKFLNTRRNNL